MNKQISRFKSNNSPFQAAASINLCSRCLRDFRTADSFLIERNMAVEITDTCLFCNVRRGFEYFVVSKNVLSKRGHDV